MNPIPSGECGRAYEIIWAFERWDSLRNPEYWSILFFIGTVMLDLSFRDLFTPAK